MVEIPEKHQRYFTSALVFGVLAALGMIVSLAAVEDFTYARTSYKWPVVDGVVLSSDNGKLRYAYFYEGASYEGNKNSFIFGVPMRQNQNGFVAGQRVKVSVLPSDPKIAILVTGGSVSLFAGAIAFSIFFVFVGLAGAVRAMSLLDLEAGIEFDEEDYILVEGVSVPAE